MKVTSHWLGKGKPWKTPYYIANGSSPGSTLMITSGVHGNERASVNAAKKLLGLLQEGEMFIQAGKLILVPIVNQEAYRLRIRGIPDLNRTFPRRPSQGACHPLSAAMFGLMQRHRPSWFIDLHEANGLSQFNRHVLGQTLVTQPDRQSAVTARRIVRSVNRSIPQSSNRFNVRLHHLRGSGRTAAYRFINARAITVETCWSLPFSERVHYQLQIVRQLLIESNLVTDEESCTNSAAVSNYRVRPMKIKRSCH
ncbi:succinylglutamate desuccinylase/aspartoacylase family protein [Paenibacillus filicis]|uniref:Succinylglutamate desuccinylase/aspartoacylase family protein n=1 Tax=Paenibacillus gyeongsangnamensis TaxID=3388067 RepID=A0ABT4QGJ6_9BACL|nr:succinylglutamate desuccinylase/aspartoacylase family protein [Paenibacillus filicis]MCZ8515990.1 succinylglutamate desuccinylase/aspartoacylase family protein [Paenibacillus filicis]